MYIYSTDVDFILPLSICFAWVLVAFWQVIQCLTSFLVSVVTFMIQYLCLVRTIVTSAGVCVLSSWCFRISTSAKCDLLWTTI